MSEQANLVEQLPPHSKDAERAVLGSILRDSSVLDDVLAILPSAEDFYVKAHQQIYAAIRALRDRGEAPDTVTVAEELHRADQVKELGGYGYLGTLYDCVPAAANAVYYAHIVRDKRILYRLWQACDVIKGKTIKPNGSAQEMAAEAARLVCGIEAHDVDDVRPLSAVLEDTADLIDRIYTQGAAGLPYGLTDLDKITAGMHAGELIVAAARPGVGKSQLGLQVARETVKAGHPALFASLEMSAHAELAFRLICAESRTDLHKLRSGWASEWEREDYRAMARIAREWPLFLLDSPGLNCSRILSGARRVKRQSGLALVVVDYLQLVEAEGRFHNEQESVASVSKQLKRMARELDCPVLALCQLNRNAENRAEGEPMLADLRASGSIEQDADTVLMLWRDPKVATTIKLKVAKQRNGPVGTVELFNRPDVQRFENLAKSPVS